jgi:hypothetical protein
MKIKENDIKIWAECNDGVVWIDDIPWQIRNRILLPLCLPHTNQNIDRNKVKNFLMRSNALLAHWTDEWDRSESLWWWTCCDNKEYDLEKITNTDGRKNIRKGLRECIIDRIDVEKFLDESYQVHYQAANSYGISKNLIQPENEFKNFFLKMSKYSGFEFWGAYFNNKLVAFATCLVLDNAVLLTNTRSDPNYHKHRPNNALIYKLTHYYLKDRNVTYITNGPRTLLHQTSINSFLIKMGYRKIYGRLNLVLSKKANLLILLGVSKWGKYLDFIERFLPNQWASLNGFLKIHSISKSFYNDY